MKHHIRNVCSFLVAVILTGGSPAVSAADSSGSPAELESLLKRWEQGHVSKDRKADLEFAKNFLADDYELITGEGMVLGRDMVLKSFEVGEARLSHEVLERKTRLNGDTAVVKELCQFELPQHGHFKTWTTLVLMKKQGQWKLCLSQVTVVQ